MIYQTTEDVLKQARRLRGKSLLEIVGKKIDINPGNKGAFGQLVESYGFGIPTNSSTEPDFQPVGIELKVVPLKKSGRTWTVKERTKICMVDYHKLVKEQWNSSHCKSKLTQILFVFYRHETDIWSSSVEDHLLYVLDHRNEAEAIKNEWSLIKSQVSAGQAHSLSESLTSRLAASTAGPKGKDVPQPYSAQGARKRAFSLKPSYTKTLRAELIKRKQFDSLESLPEFDSTTNVGDFLLKKLHRYEGQLIATISEELQVPIQGGKASNAGFIRKMLGFSSGKAHIKEIAECGITLRVVPVNPKTGKLREAISFPHQKLSDIIEESDFENSALCSALESLLIVPIYRGKSSKDPGARLGRARFWEPNSEELEHLQSEWELCKQRIEIYAREMNSTELLPSDLLPSTQTHVIHFRPHARNAKDTENSIGIPIVKSSFWLNQKAVSI